MNKEEKERVTAVGAVVTGGAFALGWFLHKPKAMTGIVLSELTVTPNDVSVSEICTISVRATNTTAGTLSGDVVIHAGNTVERIPVTLAAHASQVVDWEYTTEYIPSTEVHQVTASVDDLQTALRVHIGG
jgi:hypothetical protein